MKTWHWIGVLVVAVMLGISWWWLYLRPTHPAARAPAFTASGVTVQFAVVGRWNEDNIAVIALCSSVGDRLYVSAGGFATSVAVVPGGCAAAPRPGK